MGKDFVDTRYAKEDDYLRILKEIQATGKCPFCQENFKWHEREIICSYRNWFLTENFKPYPNAEQHLLIVGKEHKERLNELTPDDLKDVLYLSYVAEIQFNIKGSALTIRSGDSEYTGATVKHLHFHLIVPEKGKVVNFPIG